MEPPVDLNPDSIHDEKVKVFDPSSPSVRTALPRRQSEDSTTTASWTGTDVPGDRQEQDVSPGSVTETFAAYASAWIPGAGGCRPAAHREAALPAHHGDFHPFQETSAPALCGTPPLRERPERAYVPNPAAGRHHDGLPTQYPGPSTDMRTVNMDFSYGSAFGEELPDAYERLLLDAMVGGFHAVHEERRGRLRLGFHHGDLGGWGNTGTPRARPLPGGRLRTGGCHEPPGNSGEKVEAPVSTVLDPRSIEREIARIRERESNPYSSGVKTNLFTLVIFREQRGREKDRSPCPIASVHAGAQAGAHHHHRPRGRRGDGRDRERTLLPGPEKPRRVLRGGAHRKRGGRTGRGPRRLGRPFSSAICPSSHGGRTAWTGPKTHGRPPSSRPRASSTS